MARVYTANLWKQYYAPAGLSSRILAGPDDTVVIRSIDATNQLPRRGPCRGFIFTDDDTTAPLWRIDIPEAVTFKTYHWRGRAVIGGGQQLDFIAGVEGWGFWMGGYILTP